MKSMCLSLSILFYGVTKPVIRTNISTFVYYDDIESINLEQCSKILWRREFYEYLRVYPNK